MNYHCTATMELADLIGHDGPEGFEYGPLALALRAAEPLHLDNSASLSGLMLAKIEALTHMLFIVETEEVLQAQAGFRLVLH